MSEALLLAASFAVLLSGALLFTNGVEWLGHRLSIAQGAVGSILAAVATALPESLIPVVALIKGEEGSDDVAIGAIIGAPFLLGTLAMALVGVSVVVFRRRRPTGLVLDAHRPTLRRDLGVFIAVFAVAMVMGIGLPGAARIPVAVALVVAYGVYVRATLRGSGAVQEETTLKPLFLDTTRADAPSMTAIVVQLAVALGAIVGGAHLFVEELLTVAETLGVTPLVLALVLAPLATELPEKANSFFWTREGKDSLALGNITGAMVFQSTLPVAIGLAFSDWDLGWPSLLAGGLALAGGALAVLTLGRPAGRLGPAPVGIWLALYAGFVLTVIVAG